MQDFMSHYFFNISLINIINSLQKSTNHLLSSKSKSPNTLHINNPQITIREVSIDIEGQSQFQQIISPMNQPYGNQYPNQPLIANQYPPPPHPQNPYNQAAGSFQPFQQPNPYQPKPYAPNRQGFIPNGQGFIPNGITGRLPCPFCLRQTDQITKRAPGGVTFLWCFAVFLFTGIFCCIPFCVDSCKDTVIHCTLCNGIKGRIEANCC